jgi:hypothetical protein
MVHFINYPEKITLFCHITVASSSLAVAHLFSPFQAENGERYHSLRLVSFIYLIHVHIYPYRLGNPLDVEQVIARNAHAHKNKMTAIK